MSAWVWLLAAGAAVWALTRQKTAVEALPSIDDGTMTTDRGQRVEIVTEGPPIYEGPDMVQISPQQIYWSDAFLQEVWDRQNSFSARIGASDLKIYVEVRGTLRESGILSRDGQYTPHGGTVPLDIAQIAYEAERPPFWR